jgi:DNA helicase-2/ATP-dependent DNA helicase PcrA
MDDYQQKIAQMIQHLRATLREGQRAMADWQGGELAVSAVPGAGKSTGMAVSAAIAIARFGLHRQRQLVIVTFTRSAASNIRQKVRRHLDQWQLPQSAFTVNTLHGLAFGIASSYPELSGISISESQVISESQKQGLIRKAVQQWIRENPSTYEALVAGREPSTEESEVLRRQMALRTEILPSLLRQTIDTAKSANLSPAAVAKVDSEILRIASQLYRGYNQLLQDQGVIDYDDMILGAIRVLDDPLVRRSWQERTFAVFEDEAQDSSPLQTKLLEILAQKEDQCNLIRVGDPNQAINSTFTTADPRFFNSFCDRCFLQNRYVSMDQAGRSNRKIIAAANYFLQWVNNSQYAQKEKPFRHQMIRPVPLNDPQPNANPPELGRGVEIYPPQKVPTFRDEMQMISDRLKLLYQENPDLSSAIIVRQNNQGKFVYDFLKESLKDSKIKIYDVEQRDRRSRVPADMLTVLKFMARPHSPDNLKALLRLLVERQRISPYLDLNALANTPEKFLYPTVLDQTLEPLSEDAELARRKCIAILKGRFALPVYYLIPFSALALNYEQSELATADKLSDRLEQELRGNLNLDNLVQNLQVIVEGESFEAVEEENLEASYMQKGQVTIINYHKSKGLDWDVVFLPFVSDRFFPGRSFVPDSIKFVSEYPLSEICRAQLRSLIHGDEIPEPDQAWDRAGLLKQAEEFRLLYVGMTRAKRLLWISCAQINPFNWNDLRNTTDKQNLCPAIAALLNQQT